jgi:hypothetical protein
MDVFLSTFHTAAEAGSVALPAAKRHLSIFKSCVDQDDTAVLMGRCGRPLFDYYVMLTKRRLVVVRETRLLHLRRLHLNANLRHLSHVTWRLDFSKPSIEVAATAMDGVRERFRMRLGDDAAVWAAEELLRQVFLGSRGETVAPPARMPRTTAVLA